MRETIENIKRLMEDPSNGNIWENKARITEIGMELENVLRNVTFWWIYRENTVNDFKNSTNGLKSGLGTRKESLNREMGQKKTSRFNFKEKKTIENTVNIAILGDDNITYSKQ